MIVPGIRAQSLPGLALALLMQAGIAGAAAPPPEKHWPQFEAFVQRFVSTEGRVVDPISAPRYTTSEGQGYALFFALVADDRALFERLLVWTRDNLAAGDFAAHLPAWQWGLRSDGNWGVADANPAADADLWLAYTLLEAGRIWEERRYRVLGKLIAHRILAEETADLPGLGRTMLPAPTGFHPTPERWRLNPSYGPVPLLRGLVLADETNADAWRALAASAQALITDSASQGYAPDWTLFETGRGFLADAETGGIGSYNAIRVYLWAGLMANDESRAAQLAALSGMADRVPPPEVVETVTGRARGEGPSGFAAALIPFQRALRHESAAATLAARVAAAGWPVEGYYDSVLTLFAQGHEERRYCFDADGRLHHLPEPSACAPEH